MTTDYKQLRVWQQAMQLVREIYDCTRAFPREEMFGLSAQMRRAAVSVPSNIAEGKGRYSQKELLQFLFKARGSLLELETQVLIAHDLAYIDQHLQENLTRRILDVAQLLGGLIKKFQQNVQENTVAKPERSLRRTGDL